MLIKLIGKGVNHVVGTGRKACVRYGPLILGGSGEIRTRDQRIKRSRSSSKSYIKQWSTGQINDCAIECAIAYWCIVRICRPDIKLFKPQNTGRNSQNLKLHYY